MPPKRKSDGSDELTGREKKKAKTVMARTIAVQSVSGNAVAGSSRSVRFDSMRGLPSTLDVEKFTESRAFEINAMQNAMQSARDNATQRAWQQLPRHLRRRAASHDVRRVPLRLRDKARTEMDPARRKALGRSMPKRGKDKRLSRTKTLLKRQVEKIWLETHIWHAKRMKMENMWGYRLAVKPTEKAFRPSHRASVHGSILHDASYYAPIGLTGPVSILRAILDSCCDPQAPSPGAARYLSGARACETHIYKYLSYPFDLIAPISVIWQPLASVDSPQIPVAQVSEDPVSTLPSGSHKRKRKGKKGPDKEGSVQLPSDTTRTLWLRVHPTVYVDVFLAVQTAASFALEVFKKTSNGKECDVEISDLRERVNVFEIMGPKSSQILKGALRPVAEEKREDFKKFWNSLENLQSTGSLPRGMIIGFKVYDPRLNFPPKNAKVKIDSSKLPNLSPASTVFPSCTLAKSEIWSDDVRNQLRKPRFKKKDLDQRKSENLIPGTALQATKQDDRVPVLLIQHSTESTNPIAPSLPAHGNNTAGLHGWTLIIPSGWSMPFFSSLIFTGTRVAGQRERQTQFFEAGCAHFPRDYPCTHAYNELSFERANEEQARWERKPPAKRPNYDKVGTRSPWKPDWEVVLGIAAPPPEEMVVDDSIVEADLVSAQREDPPSITAAVTEGAQARAWLLRGPDLRALLARIFPMLMPSAGLIDELNQLRAKRKQDPLSKSAEYVWQSALVQIRVVLCGRGSPDDLAAIYYVDDEEARKWVKAILTRKTGRGALLEEGQDETELSKFSPGQDSIIGYVTTGNFSLSRGEGYAIGAVPVAQLRKLYMQAERLHPGSSLLVKFRNRGEDICRPAYIEVLES